MDFSVSAFAFHSAVDVLEASRFTMTAQLETRRKTAAAATVLRNKRYEFLYPVRTTGPRPLMKWILPFARGQPSECLPYGLMRLRPSTKTYLAIKAPN